MSNDCENCRVLEEHAKALDERLAEADQEAQEYLALFNMRHKADMRAITRWRREKPDQRVLRMPDHADLVVWLNEENEKLYEACRNAHLLVQRMRGETCSEENRKALLQHLAAVLFGDLEGSGKIV